MRQAKSFIEVLEEQIRQDLRRELSEEIRAEMRDQMADETHSEREAGARRVSPQAKSELSETWLAANVGKSFFQRGETAKHFYRKAAAPAPKATPATEAPSEKKFVRPEPVRQRAVTAEEIFAVETIERAASVKLGLASGFTEAQLKSAWRRAALNTHPDRHSSADREMQARMGSAFSEIALAYDTLARLFRD